jgi:uncharacterized lipoprotein YehR (DUF1307 family)
MSKSTRIVFGLCMLAFVAACAKKEEPVTFVEEPVSAEPTFTGKYK